VADEQSGKTVKDRVWAGGDVVTGAATVISAMGAGKRAAASIHEFLMGK
jgi:glutamate synthase (NADPH/NADH) small chain